MVGPPKKSDPWFRAVLRGLQISSQNLCLIGRKSLQKDLYRLCETYWGIGYPIKARRMEPGYDDVYRIPPSHDGGINEWLGVNFEKEGAVIRKLALVGNFRWWSGPHSLTCWTMIDVASTSAGEGDEECLGEFSLHLNLHFTKFFVEVNYPF